MYPIIDLHCDTILACEEKQLSLYQNNLHVDLCKLKAAHAYAQCFAIFIDQEDCKKRKLSPHQRYKQVYEYYREQLLQNSTLIAPLYETSALQKNRDADRISAILTVEGGEVLEGKLSNLDILYEDGVRALTFTWNYENEIAYPNGSTKGLKLFGYEVIERMNEIGMIIDISHLSDAGFYDVITHSNKPVAATHSCVRALCAHSRNMTDDMLRKLGEHGGIIGLNFYSRFLQERGTTSTMQQVLLHARHIVDVAGIDALALGSDYDGIDCELEWKDYSGMPKLLDFLSCEFHESEMEKICYRNAERFLHEVI